MYNFLPQRKSEAAQCLQRLLPVHSFAVLDILQSETRFCSSAWILGQIWSPSRMAKSSRHRSFIANLQCNIITSNNRKRFIARKCGIHCHFTAVFSSKTVTRQVMFLLCRETIKIIISVYGNLLLVVKTGFILLYFNRCRGLKATFSLEDFLTTAVHW